MAMHIIPFKGREHSGPVNQNLLWRDRNIYLMDNHRAALWCWQQEIDLYAENHCLLHIDRHTDCLGANLQTHLDAMPDLRGISIDDYLGAQVNLACGPASLFRWDNYLSIHIAAFNCQLKRLFSADHGDGDNPDFAETLRPRPDEIPENVQYWLNSKDCPWIVNIDLDYFFCAGEDGSNVEQSEWLPIFSDAYIDAIFTQVRDSLNSGKVKALTVCLTPSNFTPGWQECLDLSKRIFDIVGAAHPQI
jgi:hypothetical protein